MGKRLFAFTLAEMMVVMLILTIILAAFAPLMTKRKPLDTSSPWRYAANNSDIYYGLNANQTAMIGQNEKKSTDLKSRLLINASDSDQSHITFSRANNKLGQLYIHSSGIVMLGGPDSINGTFGPYNTGIGFAAFGAGKLDNTSHSNTAVGYTSLYNTTGVSNTAIGARTLYSNTQGGYNIAVGNGALYNNTTGTGNTAIGSNALMKNASGSNNVAIGQNACHDVTGSNKTCIGQGSGPTSSIAAASNDEKVMYLGDSDTTVYIPGNLLVIGNFQVSKSFKVSPSESRPVRFRPDGAETTGGTNLVYPIRLDWGSRQVIGDGDVSKLYYEKLEDPISIYSDIRLKNIKDENKSGLEQVRELKVFNYTFKDDKTPQVGVIAQDLEKVFPDAVKKADDGYLKIRWDDMFYAVINSVKQLDKIVQALIGEIKIIEIKLDTLIKQENAKDKKIKDLEKRIEKLEKHFS